jgi:hypothetical protein
VRAGEQLDTSVFTTNASIVHDKEALISDQKLFSERLYQASLRCLLAFSKCYELVLRI